MLEEMKKEDFLNDLKLLASWLGSYLLSTEVKGLIGVLGSFVVLIYSIYRLYKLVIDTESSKLDRDIKKMELEELKKSLKKD